MNYWFRVCVLVLWLDGIPRIAQGQPQGLPLYPASAGEDLGPVPAWFSAAIERDRHTTFLARFDDRNSCDADYARGIRFAGGMKFRSGVAAKYGAGVEISAHQAQVNYSAQGNLPPARGTIQFWARSLEGQNIWKDGLDHWFLASRAIANDLELRKDSQNRLVLSWGRWPHAEPGRIVGALAIPVAKLDPAAWHPIALSWDSQAGRIWLAVDSNLRSLALGSPLEVDEFMILFLGSSHEGGYHNLKDAEPRYLSATAGAVLDELKISDSTIPELIRLQGVENPLSDAEAIRLLDAVRKHYDFIAQLQVDGSWSAPVFAWPHLLPGTTSYRTYFHTGRRVNVTHARNGTPAAGQMFLYAYQVLGDRKYLEAAEKTGDWVRAAQQAEGYWAGSYERHTAAPPTRTFTVTGITGQNLARPSLHDGMQSQPAQLLALLYLETRHPRWLEGFRKAADFLLRAQNPNGSWSHNYNVTLKRGENRHDHFHAGDFSNGIMHSQMTIMLLAYQITGDKKYFDSLQRAGDWILAAQQGPPTFGWASHYDSQNRPAWGRAWEPPAISSVGAPDLLLFMFDLTGQKKYLDAVARFSDWDKEKGVVRLKLSNREIQGRPQYHDSRTGRPVLAQNMTIYHLDNPRDRAAYLKNGYPNPDGLSEDEFPWLGTATGRELVEPLAKREQGKPVSAVMLDRDQLGQSIVTLKQTVAAALGTQNPQGVWPDTDDRRAGIGPHIRLVDERPEVMLALIERCKILTGELQREIWSYPGTSMPYCYSLPGLKYRNWLSLAKVQP